MLTISVAQLNTEAFTEFAMISGTNSVLNGMMPFVLITIGMALGFLVLKFARQLI